MATTVYKTAVASSLVNDPLVIGETALLLFSYPLICHLNSSSDSLMFATDSTKFTWDIPAFRKGDVLPPASRFSIVPQIKSSGPPLHYFDFPL